jgi:hypothetical protein
MIGAGVGALDGYLDDQNQKQHERCWYNGSTKTYDDSY